MGMFDDLIPAKRRPAQIASTGMFDDLIPKKESGPWEDYQPKPANRPPWEAYAVQANCPGGLEIDHQFKLYRFLDRKVGRFCTL